MVEGGPQSVACSLHCAAARVVVAALTDRAAPLLLFWPRIILALDTALALALGWEPVEPLLHVAGLKPVEPLAAQRRDNVRPHHQLVVGVGGWLQVRLHDLGQPAPEVLGQRRDRGGDRLLGNRLDAALALPIPVLV